MKNIFFFFENLFIYFFQFDSSLTRTRSDISKKPEDDKSRVPSKYGSNISTGYQRDVTSPGISFLIKKKLKKV